MNDASKHRLLWVLGIVFAVWGLLIFFESGYFAAFFYGVTPPWIFDWVGNVPVWTFDAIDTVMAALLIVALVASVSHTHKRRRMASSRGVVGEVVVVLLVLLLAALLFYLGFTLTGLWSDLKGFFGV